MEAAGATVANGQQPGDDRRFFGHPRGLATLFFTEFWERWGYYGMRSLLILYMTAAASSGGMGFDVAKASAIYGLYTALAYLSSLPGGWIADRVLGQRKAVLVGGVIIAAGYLMLAAPGEGIFYVALATVITGTGLLKANASTLVGQIYAQGDNRRDAGFSIFYMGINMGAFFAPLACGLVAQSYSWRAGMALAGLGMVVGVAQYVHGWKYLGNAGLNPAVESAEEARRERRRLWKGCAVVVALGLGLYALDGSGVVTITAQGLVNLAGSGLLVITLALFGWMFLAAEWTPVERKRLAVVAVLFLASCLFWSAFEQAGSTLNLFADRATDKTLFGWTYPAAWLQSLNGFFIWTLAPVFAWFWMRLGAREPSSPAKFAWGLVLLGMGYMVLVGGAVLAEGGKQVSPMWLTTTYLFHTLGELCLSPVGLSAITKLSPARVGGLMMGVWFLSISIGNYMGGRIAGFYEALPLPWLFAAVGGFAIAAGLVLALFVKPMTRLMGGVK